MGDTGGSTSGYDGWSCLTTGSFTAWNYTTAGDTLNFVDTNSPSVVTQVLGVTDPTSSISRYVLTPNASTVIDLEQLTFTYNQNVLGTITPFTETGTVVTTAEGSLGIYYLSPAAQYYDLNPDLSLVDATDLPVSVNSIINFSGDYILGNLTIKPVLFALTDSGVYFTQNPKGGSWQSLGQQSGITDQNITGLAVGQPQTLVTHIVTRLYATSSSSLWCSHTGGIFWDDEVADTITVGAYLSELGKLIGQIPFLNNTVTSIGTAYSTAALGTSGTNIPGPLPAPYNLDGDLVWERVLDEHNKWTYRLVHTASAAPYAPIEFGEVTELVTDSATNHFVASGILAKAKVRYLGDKSRLQVTATVRSSFARTTHKLRTLRPTHLVNLLYIPGGPFPQAFSNTPLFVINHKLYKTDTVTQNSVYTETVLSSVLRTAEITMNEVVDGLIYVFGKAHRKAGLWRFTKRQARFRHGFFERCLIGS